MDMAPADSGGGGMSRLSWKKRKSTGSYRSAKAYELFYGVQYLATAQEDKKGMWFWYGDDLNTSWRPESLAFVKAEAMAHFRNKMKAQKKAAA